jgi:hypothetical protein
MHPVVAPARRTGMRARTHTVPAVLVVAALALASPARADVATPDANDTPDTAQGPLSEGVTYTGATDSDIDDDWFTFAVAAGRHQVSISVFQPTAGTCTLPGDGAFLELYGPNADDDPSIAQVSGAGPGPPQEVTTTLSGPATYYLDLGTDCPPGAPWAMRIDAPGALSTPDGSGSGGGGSGGSGSGPGSTTAPSTSPTSGLSPAAKAGLCRKAKRSQARWNATVNRTRRDLTRARRPVTRRLERRILKLERSTLQRLQDRVRLYC